MTHPSSKTNAADPGRQDQPLASSTATPSSTPSTDYPVSPAPRAEALLVGWSLWLLASWMLSLSSIRLSVLPALRQIAMAAIVGITVLWPIYRLCQSRPDSTTGRLSLTTAIWVFRDWLALNAVWLAAALALRLLGHWSIAQVFWLAAAVAAWSLAAGLPLLWWQSGGRRAGLGAVACLLILLGEPVAMALITLAAGPRPAASWTMWVSPLQTVWNLSAPYNPAALHTWPRHVLAAGAVAVVGWAWTLWIAARNAAKNPPNPPQRPPTGR